VDTQLDIESSDSEMGKFTKYIHKIIMSPIRKLRDYTIASSSPQCRYLCITSSTVDTTGSSLTASDKADMVMTGILAAHKLMHSLDTSHPHMHETEHMHTLSKLSTIRRRVVKYDHLSMVDTHL
jgi:hypothetical protein